MSEVWLRIAIVAGAILVIALVVALMRRNPVRKTVGSTGDLTPGIYLFTSGTCADCGPARERLVEMLGPGGFREIEWEQDPDSFARAGIEMVPSTLVVGVDGSATSFPGIPDDAVERFNP
jgi:hypothetical protein